MKPFAIAATVLVIFAHNATIAAPDAERIVSLDFCADQYVLKMLPRSRILALSPNAGEYFSYMRDSATNIPTVRPVAEDVLTLKPDLIIRSYGGGPHASRFFELAGVSVLQVPFTNSFEDIRSTIRHIADGLGVAQKGEEIISTMNRRLENIRKSDSKRMALYMTPTGVTSGPGTLIHEMFQAADLGNFQRQPGWRSIPLERLAYEQPAVIAAAFFTAEENYPSMWSPMRHPVAKKQMIDQPTVMLQGAWTACAGWYLLDAIEALAKSAATDDSR
ncbi:MAG: ABC transporter substrate-binding protein [Woeseiaceae bacterium]|jgi:iron complex transport system substrate-binding protein|nr:ABC transporter substrate-binding protein [Woeseiaceae bacterium]